LTEWRNKDKVLTDVEFLVRREASLQRREAPLCMVPGTEQPTPVGGGSVMSTADNTNFDFGSRLGTIRALGAVFIAFGTVFTLLFWWALGGGEIPITGWGAAMGVTFSTMLGAGLALHFVRVGPILTILEDEKEARGLLITQTMVDERLAWLASCFNSACDNQRKLHQERAKKDFSAELEEEIRDAEALVSSTKVAYWKEHDRYARLGYEVRDSHMDYPLEDAEPEPAIS